MAQAIPYPYIKENEKMENKEKITQAVGPEIEVKKEEVISCGEYKLLKPIMINGELAETLAYDLEELTGEDIAIANKELLRRGIMVTVTEFDQSYHAMIFAIASGIAFEDVQKLKAKDYNKVCSIVRNFLLNE